MWNIKIISYSFQLRDQIFVKGCKFLSVTKDIGNNIGKNIIRNLSSNYSQKLLDHAKQSATDTLKVSISPQNASKTFESETEIPRERYIYIYI